MSFTLNILLWRFLSRASLNLYITLVLFYTNSCLCICFELNRVDFFSIVEEIGWLSSGGHRDRGGKDPGIPQELLQRRS